jgi:O-antigen/teichoic acid export membrane protein
MDETERSESEFERLDRNFNELLQELRVSQTGVQILFAFLLTLPFTQRFGDVTRFERDVYFVTLILSGMASALFIGPVSYHRVLFRKREKSEVVFVANRMAVGGLLCLALAITGVILLVTDFLFGGVAAAIASGCMGALILVLWYTLPLARLLRIRRETQT